MFDINAVNMAIKGDTKSFEVLYDNLSLELYKYAYYILGNEHDAEDVVSETFIEAMKGIKNLKHPETFKSWMFKILSARVKRKISTYVRDKKNMELDDVSAAALSTEDFNTVENVMLQKALQEITSEERSILLLSTVQGYTTKEVAGMLELPQGTVSSKLHRTLKKLRKMME